ncbi:MAG: hypothetical protein J3K34DRAFT_405402 [Monoraphidium minutum]|nr:MAG: hypothetical protein J3K34DRAFT_405402 [Monoraphidium minutum]
MNVVTRRGKRPAAGAPSKRSCTDSSSGRSRPGNHFIMSALGIWTCTWPHGPLPRSSRGSGTRNSLPGGAPGDLGLPGTRPGIGGRPRLPPPTPRPAAAAGGARCEGALVHADRIRGVGIFEDSLPPPPPALAPKAAAKALRGLMRARRTPSAAAALAARWG